MDDRQKQVVQRANAIGGGVAVAIGLAVLIAMSLATVQAGFRGVKTRFGQVVLGALEPGLHFRIPLVEKIKDVEVREQKMDMETSASSMDLQTVQSKVAVNFRPDPDSVDNLYNEVGLDYESRILNPAVEETVKAVTAQYTAEQLITKRTEVRDKMETQLRERMLANHLNITKFNIVNFEFSRSFNEAIEAKQTAEQEALRASNDLRRIAVEADQQIEEARGEAESIKLRAQAEADAITMRAEAEAKAQELLAKFVNRDVIHLRTVEKWDGVMPRVTGDAIPLLNIGQDMADTAGSAVTAEAALTRSK